MKDGYYLAIYTDINDVACFYQSSIRNDHNMTLFYKENNRVEVVHIWEFERFSRIKRHGVAFPGIHEAEEFINLALSEYNLTLKDLQGIFGTEELDSIDKNIYSSISCYRKFPYHSICHIYSSMLNSEKYYEETILALAMDGGPDLGIDHNAYNKNFYCGALIRRGELELFSITSPGALWMIASNYFGLREGTLMALASATETCTYEKDLLIENVLNIDDIKKAKIQVEQFIEHVMEYSKKDYGVRCSVFDPHFTDLENRISIVMKIIQDVSINMIEKQIFNILDEFNLNAKEVNLALSGGFTLNCPTNSYLMNRFEFKSQMMCPCTNDSGLSLGMGLFYFYKNIPKLKFEMERFDLGSIDNTSLKSIINKYRSNIKSIRYTMDYFTDDLKRTLVWFQGRSEIGPRALGQRSILSSATSLECKKRLNKYKQREWWRPVAPIILQDYLQSYFERSFHSPYMLNTFYCKKEKIDEIPAVLHHDNSARVQTLSRNENPLLYEGIYRNYLVSGIPIIANTSLNDKGEPIIHSIERAIEFALEKSIPVVYYNGVRIELHTDEKHGIKSKDENISRLWKLNRSENCVNPFGLQLDQIKMYIRLPELRKYDLANEKDLKKIVKILTLLKSKYFDDNL